MVSKWWLQVSTLHHTTTYRHHHHHHSGHSYLTLLSSAASSGATTLNPSAIHAPNALPKRLNKDQAYSKYGLNKQYYNSTGKTRGWEMCSGGKGSTKSTSYIVSHQ